MLNEDIFSSFKCNLFIAILFLCLYIFFSSVDIGVTTTIFLTLALIFFMFRNGYFIVNKVTLLELSIILISWIQLARNQNYIFNGIIYLISISLVFLLVKTIKFDSSFIKYFKNGILISTCIILISVYAQLINPFLTLALYANILQKGAYEICEKAYLYNSVYSGVCGYDIISAFSISLLSGYCFINTIFYKGKKYKKIFWIILTIFSLCAIMLTGKRSIFVITIFSLSFLVLTSGIMSKTKKIVIFFSGLLFMLIAYNIFADNSIFSSFIDRLFGRQMYGDTDYTSNRLFIINYVLNLIDFENLMLGHGTGSLTGLIMNAFNVGGGAHNIYLQILCENGILGLILWCLFFYKNLICTLQFRIVKNSFIVYYSLYVQFIFLLYGLFGNPLYDVSIFCIYIIFAYLPKEYYKLNNVCRL